MFEFINALSLRTNLLCDLVVLLRQFVAVSFPECLCQQEMNREVERLRLQHSLKIANRVIVLTEIEANLASKPGDARMFERQIPGGFSRLR